MTDHTLAALLAAAAVLVLATVRHWRTAIFAPAPLPRDSNDPSKRWPKQPPTVPFLGHQLVLNANSDRFLDLFLEWRLKYGPGYEVSLSLSLSLRAPSTKKGTQADHLSTSSPFLAGA